MEKSSRNANKLKSTRVKYFFSHLTQSLQTECSVLRDSLSDFSHWTRHKLQLMEDDLDIFRVVYSLHGSLSKVGGEK